ncbi:MAG TPA: hypothetical protein VM286_04370 [Candidatus Thermoplasmatota archaeon]|nr:hypothetical protein [Candidatus Thermoplasmatota archaeon]
MTQNTTADNKPTDRDFSNFRWISGARAGDSACVSIDPQGAVRLGLRGFDKKHGKPGYIPVHLDLDGLRAMRALLDAAIAAATAHSYEAAIAAIQAA